jgi:ubiquinone/menaquinone biosynthesis C-methylase UbiE/uncharacterized protein YbaR (Trm112 family)
MNDWLLGHLACPRDKRPLSAASDSLTCPEGHIYAIVNGIPVLIFDDGDPTHDYLLKSLEQVELIRSGEALESVTRPCESDNGSVDGFVQGELPYTNGNLYFSVQHKLTRYPLPYLRLPESNGETLLDVGCNWGRWSIRAAQKGYQPVGIDPSLDAVLAAQRIARQLGVEASFVVADSRHLPFVDGAFDVVFSYGVLQHFSKANAKITLAEMNRVLIDGGKVLAQMPNKYGIRSFQQRWRRGFTEGEAFEVRYWTPSELVKTFTDLFGNTKFSADCYFGLGIQASDVDILPLKFKTVVYSSEALRGLSKMISPMAKLADSVYLESIKSKTSAANSTE